MTHYENSGSEDGQLRSPGDEFFISGNDDDLDENDSESLDIKPPQATKYSRGDIATNKDSKRYEHASRETKHSKERSRQHRDRSGGQSNTEAANSGSVYERERDRRIGAGGGVLREGRPEMERYQRAGGLSGGGYERNDSGRYQKHYDRGRDNHGMQHHHHNHQQSGAMHMHRRQADFYERMNDYHHHNNDYHPMRPNYNSNKHHGQRVDYGEHDIGLGSGAPNMQRDRDHARERERERDRERDRDRRKYTNFEGQQQDAESLEQDLRSRLLSKRHKYVKDYDSSATRKHQMELEAVDDYDGREGVERSYEDSSHKQRYAKSRHEKALRNSVIEVFDSPDISKGFEEIDTAEAAQSAQHSKKHKRHGKEKHQETSSTVVDKHRSPEDQELLARRTKLLMAERENFKRKEAAREELAARREKRRERKDVEVIDELSPTAVAANVAAGLNIVIKRHKSAEKRKKSKKSKRQRSDYEDGEHYEESGSNENSEAESEQNVVTLGKRHKHSSEAEQHVKRKKRKHKSDVEDDDVQLTDDEDVSMNAAKARCEKSGSDSAVESVDSYKQRKSKRKHSKKSDREKRHKRKKRASNHAVDSEEDDDAEEEDKVKDNAGGNDLKIPESPLSIGELSKSADGHRRKLSNTNDNGDHDDHFRISRSPSPTHSATDDEDEDESRSPSPHSSTHSSRSRSRSHSRSSSRHSVSTSGSRSRSGTHTPCTRSSTSPSLSRSRSRSRSEERDMQANLRKSDAEQRSLEVEKRKSGRQLSPSPIPCDDKGVALPNYYPGLQGCRSVEEFQCLNRIEEGTYGVVYRARDKRTSEIVALKRLKMEKEKEGFPITSLREINTLLKGQHPNIVTVREIVVGSNMDKIFIVMDYVEHDLKSLMETMKARKQCFLPGEVKCLTQQLLRAVGHLHDNWILHRDLKTSNLLLSHKGILKVGDFGLAREYGSPLKKYTSLVVTLWYRAPELLLCAPEYSTPIDIWSVGCIFGEFLQMAPLFPGKSEIDELNRIFKELGTPNEKIWPGYKSLPAVKNLLSQNSQFADYPVSNIRKRFQEKTSELGISFLQALLTYDPKQRLNAEAALKHAYFKELPLPIDPSMFPTWPAKSELGVRKALASSPKPPSGGSQFKQLGRDELVSNAAVSSKTKAKTTAGFSGIITGNKKTAANTGFVLNAGIEQRQLAMGPGFNLKF